MADRVFPWVGKWPTHFYLRSQGGKVADTHCSSSSYAKMCYPSSSFFTTPINSFQLRKLCKYIKYTNLLRRGLEPNNSLVPAHPAKDLTNKLASQPRGVRSKCENFGRSIADFGLKSRVRVLSANFFRCCSRRGSK